MSYDQMVMGTQVADVADWRLWKAPSAAQHRKALERRLRATEKAKERARKAAERKTPQPCLCGCGLTPASARSRFLPGHDGRLKGLLLVAARNGDEEARTQLVNMGWGHFLEEAKD